ncbi:hypothetical protein M0813_24510 [Anaeramoeba flamelloides]|uniref:Uncharacterized protein n=1 Tax=Anaeramoeba flamelloides TaxID=1746091 RepID=A0ABQ8Y7A5_9EUKA|nr:hypothetical protein M0813_24510 [Anaeramoeba flamelloides]
MTSKNIPIPKKLVLLGESSVGKTSLVLRYVNHFFDSRTEPTIGATYLTKTIDFPKYSLRLQIWDTAGQERYHSLAPLYYRGAHGALVVYDVENLVCFFSFSFSIFEVTIYQFSYQNYSIDLTNTKKGDPKSFNWLALFLNFYKKVIKKSYGM